MSLITQIENTLSDVATFNDLVKPDFEAEFEAELLQQKQKPINAVAETTASVLPLITIDR